MSKEDKSWHSPFTRSWLFLIVIWLFTGFALGTLTLLFPLRWWVDYARSQNLSASTESAGVITLMVLLTALSYFISLKLYRRQLGKNQPRETFLVAAIPLVLSVIALTFLMNPKFVNRASMRADVSKQFTIGAYPTDADIKQLKGQGYTGLITLLHPAVVPFEPSLLSDEKASAAKHGIELVEAPMLPWVSDNTASLKVIEDIARERKGRYYIHCYLGKDRVNVVKNLITRISGDSVLEVKGAGTHRTFEEMKRFERGELYKLGSDIYFTPFPTDEEFLAFFLAGNVKSVVNLMDSTVQENKPWINGERRDLKRAFITFRNYTVNASMKENEIRAIVDSVLTLQRPLVIHHWNTTAPESKLFLRAFTEKTGIGALNLSK